MYPLSRKHHRGQECGEADHVPVLPGIYAHHRQRCSVEASGSIIRRSTRGTGLLRQQGRARQKRQAHRPYGTISMVVCVVMTGVRRGGGRGGREIVSARVKDLEKVMKVVHQKLILSRIKSTKLRLPVVQMLCVLLVS